IPRRKKLAILLASVGTVARVLELGETGVQPGGTEGQVVSEEPDTPPQDRRSGDRAYTPERDPEKDHPTAQLAMTLLGRAVAEGATDFLIEARESEAVAKATIAGRAHELQGVPLETGKMLVARFKALAGLDVAKKRTPQTGSMDIRIKRKLIKLRLSTAPTATFENLKIRVLNPAAGAPPLGALGLSRDQALALHELANKDQGLVVFVGPSGSGKTTTICSLLTEVAKEDRSVVTVEDPIEHRIPLALQQEVRNDPEASFRSLLQRAIEKEPDVLFLGEIRGLTSARACLDFSSSGHLALSSMNSSNGATAVFRLERLGLPRAGLADALTGVVAQRVLKKLCPDCKETRPITPEERILLGPFTADPPEAVAQPSGCSSCMATGYRGQEGVFEVIRVGRRMSDLIRDGHPIRELREYAQARGDLLLGDRGLQKIRDLTFSVNDVYRNILLEESIVRSEEPDLTLEWDSDLADPLEAFDAEGHPSAPVMARSKILVVEDEEGTRFLLDQILSKAGYQVVLAGDGGEALLKLESGSIDVILSDIHMPNLDGLKLLEILNQHDIHTPVVFLTGEPSPGFEARGREMGAADYLRKPIQRDVLLACIEKVLE
ncbi:MAG: Flp pilus assembly complex ATPase component TadA, partial [Gemmatimonadetes bacterium]|nr:Flp pilus assembly complex ATPase component TadA [Gemmatimonadota bacterium]